MYGLNFGADDIPAMWRKRFKTRIMTKRHVSANSCVESECYARLIGVATSRNERDYMIVVGATQQRPVYVLERYCGRLDGPFNGQTVYGIYAS